jgi:hypothetical protein
MGQNINLFSPAFRKQDVVFSLKALVACFVITLLTLLAFQAYLQEEVNGLAEELRSAEAVLKTQRGYSDKLKGESAARKRDSQLDAEVARLEGELRHARESMDALGGGAIGTQQGFAEYMRAFSRQSLSGLWLTGLTIGGTGEIEIRGRVLTPELVPSYIQRLNREKVLAGRTFARLEMGQPKVEPEKAKAPEKDKDKDKAARAAARSPRFLEFSLATVEASKAEKAR